MTDTPREIKRMDIREFREQGFLQEANRHATSQRRLARRYNANNSR